MLNRLAHVKIPVSRLNCSHENVVHVEMMQKLGRLSSHERSVIKQMNVKDGGHGGRLPES